MRTRDIVRWRFSDSPFWYGRYVHAVIAFQWVFHSLPSEVLCIFSGGCTWYRLLHRFCHNDLFTFQFCTCVDDRFLVPIESAWISLGRQREIMVWSSARQDIYLQIDKKVYFSCFSFNFSRFEHIESLTVISWFWNLFHVLICVLPILGDHPFWGSNLPLIRPRQYNFSHMNNEKWVRK